MTEDRIFDLQRFAEESDGGDGGAGAAEPAASDPNGAGDGGGDGGAKPENPDAGADGRKTILGGDGENPPEQSAGVPEAYDFKGIVPEGMDYDEQSAAAFGEIAKKAGLSQEQASTIAAYGMQYMQQGVDAAVQAIRETQEGWAQEARTQLGGQFDATVAKAAAARNALAEKIPGLTAMLNETGAGNRIEMIRLMAAFGDLIGEDGGDRSGGAGVEKSIYPNTDFKKYS
ncbi:hypothetical protein [Selenomonas noxia]|jgi:hypothetical protein|uniref:hypothetical protein n=1 Tax=Selenomonas noxia TaxID=135083 RepID=UPI00288A1C0F|nr:hypothetical protein [Selenomonas noxia]